LRARALHRLHPRGVRRGVRARRQRGPHRALHADHREGPHDRGQRLDRVLAARGGRHHAHVLHLRVREHGHGERDPPGGGGAAAHDQLRRHGHALDAGGVRDPDVDLDAQAAGVELDARSETRDVRRESLVVLLMVVLAGCATQPTKKPSYYADDGPPESIPSNLDQIPEAVPKSEPFHRGANKPYTVFGKTYVPVVNKEPFRERGIASWYGKKFQGQKTASGEPYDMFAMTAAHPTLPIPSYAKVTNLKNGKSVVVRINDRGPFHSNRIIDLSYAAAARIGLAGPGSGLVEVERV